MLCICLLAPPPEATAALWHWPAVQVASALAARGALPRVQRKPWVLRVALYSSMPARDLPAGTLLFPRLVETLPSRPLTSLLLRVVLLRLLVAVLKAPPAPVTCDSPAEVLLCTVAAPTNLFRATSL